MFTNLFHLWNLQNIDCTTLTLGVVCINILIHYITNLRPSLRLVSVLLPTHTDPFGHSAFTPYLYSAMEYKAFILNRMPDPLKQVKYDLPKALNDPFWGVLHVVLIELCVTLALGKIALSLEALLVSHICCRISSSKSIWSSCGILPILTTLSPFLLMFWIRTIRPLSYLE